MSVTPAVEARLGHGGPLIGRLRTAGATTALGVDVVTTVDGDMFSVMRSVRWLRLRTPGNVDTVLVAGMVVKRNGRLVGHDLADVRAKAREAAEHVTAASVSTA